MPEPLSDHDLLIRLDEKFDTLAVRVDEHLEESRIRREVCEVRIAALERWQWRWVTIISLLAFLVGTFGPVFFKALFRLP